MNRIACVWVCTHPASTGRWQSFNGEVIFIVVSQPVLGATHSTALVLSAIIVIQTTRNLKRWIIRIRIAYHER